MSSFQSNTSDFDREKSKSTDLSKQAREVASDAVDTVKKQAEAVTATAKDLASDVKDKLESVVAEQKSAGADYVANLASIVGRTAKEFEGDIPQAAHYITKAAEQINVVSEAIRTKNLGQVMSDVQNFARRQPTAFFGMSLFAGFVVMRVLKSTSAAAQDSNSTHKSSL